MRYVSLKDGLVLAICSSLSSGGGIVPDLSGRGNHGTLFNMDATDYPASQYGRALDFDGANDYVSSPNIILSQDASYTACCWARMPNVTDAERRAFLETAGSSPTFTVSLAWGNDGFSGRNNKFQAFTETTTDPQVTFATSTTSPLANVWYHVASRVDTATDQISIFVNGIEEASTSFAGLLTKAGSGINIGTYRLADSRFMEGMLDDVRLYTRPLLSQEIQTLASEPGIGLKPERTSVFFGAQLFNAAWARNSNVILSPVGAS